MKIIKNYNLLAILIIYNNNYTQIRLIFLLNQEDKFIQTIDEFKKYMSHMY